MGNLISQNRIDMKKIFLLLAFAGMIISCDQHSPDDPADKDKVRFAEAMFFEACGKNTVPNVEGENKNMPFEMDSVRAEAQILTDTTLDLRLYGITFSSKMPVTIDLVIPDVRYTRTEDQITLFGENISPKMGGMPFDRYKINVLQGSITADSLAFSNNYGTYHDCTYAGKVTKML